jgi:hypothetical protein
MGFADVALRVQDLYLSGRKGAAMAAIPTALVEEVALIGPLQKVRADLEAWKSSLVTTLLVSGAVPLLRTMAELVF